MKKQIIFFIFLVTFLRFSVAQEKKELDSTLLNDTNRGLFEGDVIRFDFLSTTPFFLVAYDKKLLNNNFPLFLSFSISGNLNYLYPNIFGLEIYQLYFNNKRINPLIGIGSLGVIEYTVYPKTKKERDFVRETGMYGRQFRPPFQLITYFNIGVNIKASSKWDVKCLYSGWFGYQYSDLFGIPSNKTGLTKLHHTIRISFGYKI